MQSNKTVCLLIAAVMQVFALTALCAVFLSQSHSAPEPNVYRRVLATNPGSSDPNSGAHPFALPAIFLLELLALSFVLIALLREKSAPERSASHEHQLEQRILPVSQISASLAALPSNEIALTLSQALTMGAKNAKSYLDNMPVGLITTDQNGVVQAVNLTALRLLHCTADTLVGVNICTIISSTEMIFTSIHQLEEILQDKIMELRMHLPSEPGENSIPIDASVSSFDSQSGRGYLFNVLDVSQRHEVEKLKEEFLSIVSHDLRTPLTSIGLFINGLLLSADSLQLTTDQKKMAEVSSAEIQRTIRMVNSLLDVGRIRSGKLELTKDEVSIDALFEHLITELEPLAKQKGVSIEANTLAECLWVDPDRIYQVLENLAANAIKFSPPGTTITISAVVIDSGIRVEVKDCGPGIPLNKRDKIFERFEQVSEEDRTLKGGSGLGLAICKLIIEQHGWNNWRYHRRRARLSLLVLHTSRRH